MNLHFMKEKGKLLAMAAMIVMTMTTLVAETVSGAVKSLRIDGVSSFYGVPDLELGLDNSFSPGGQSFVFVNASEVSSGSEEPPMGTPVGWLNNYGFTSEYARAELGDQDGDGMQTWQEYIAGTIPTNRQSVFRFQVITIEPTGCQLVMPTESNRVYQVDWSDDLKAWQVLAADIKGDGKPKVLGDSMTSAKRFYRARITGFTKPPPGMVWINPGTFTMGSPNSEVDRGSNEGPQTVVTLTKGFWMGKYEVTQKEYQAVMGSNPSYWKGDNLPVETVRWDDATNYCAKLTDGERSASQLPAGYVYRLPTEAEWEYACRAGTTTRFSYGDDSGYGRLGEYAWYGDNSSSKTHPIGEKKPNAWGLYDMHGNVWEWCLDWYEESLPGGSVTDPKGPNSGSYRVDRGGSWYYGGWGCRSAYRSYHSPVSGNSDVGFRVVLAPGP